MKAILLYLLLVGTPILGILGILHLGQSLTPPIAVGGTWNIEKNLHTADDSSCDTLPIRSDQPALAISQSGTHLVLLFNDEAKTTLTGEIHDGIINAAIQTSNNDVAGIQFQAQVDRQAQPKRLLGRLISAKCPSLAAVTFTAMHQKASP